MWKLCFWGRGGNKIGRTGGLYSSAPYCHNLRLNTGTRLLATNGQIMLPTKMGNWKRTPCSRFLIALLLWWFQQSDKQQSHCCFKQCGWNKVNRCPARYSPCATTTNQLTKSALNVPARPGCSKKKAFFGAKMAIFGPNILIFTGGSKSFGTHITDKTT